MKRLLLIGLWTLFVIACSDNGSGSNNDSDDSDDNDSENGSDSNGESTLTLSVDSPTASEGDDSIIFELTISEESSEDLVVTYSTSDISATEDDDYKAASGSVTIAAGETSVTVEVDLIDDDIYECDESFSLDLTSSAGDASGTGTITNDSDAGPVLTLDATKSEVEESVGEVEIKVSLDGPVCEETTIDVAYDHISTDNTDIEESETFVISKGDSSATFTLTVVDDDEKEGIEELTITLSSTYDITVDDQDYSLTIIPTIEKLYEGYYGICAATQDSLIKCWGYAGGYNFATGVPLDIGQKYGEADLPTYACSSETLDVLVDIEVLAAGNGGDCDLNGGLRYHYGLDDDGNGALAVGERDQAEVECNENSHDVIATDLEVEDAGLNCEFGGLSWQFALDANNNDIVDYEQFGEYLLASDIGDLQVLDMGLGEYFSCALFENQRVKCWGENEYGQLGLGVNDTVNEYIGDNKSELGEGMPYVDLGDGVKVTGLSVGDYHSCALLGSGQIKCWGYNGYGSLGLGDTIDKGDSAATIGDNLFTVDLGTDSNGDAYTAVNVTVGYYHSCAILNDGRVKCWGYNSYGELGYGHTDNIGDGADEMGDDLGTVDLGDGRTAVNLFAGYYRTCAELDNGDLKCWGINDYGELGFDTVETVVGDEAGEMGENLPALQFGSSSPIVDVSLGWYHTCVLLEDTTLKCFGYGLEGNLGNDSALDWRDDSINAPTPDLGTGRTAVQLAGKGYVTCALLDNQEVKCWGNSAYGELGVQEHFEQYIGDGLDENDNPVTEMGDNLIAVDLF